MAVGDERLRNILYRRPVVQGDGDFRSGAKSGKEYPGAHRVQRAADTAQIQIHFSWLMKAR